MHNTMQNLFGDVSFSEDDSEDSDDEVLLTVDIHDLDDLKIVESPALDDTTQNLVNEVLYSPHANMTLIPHVSSVFNWFCAAFLSTNVCYSSCFDSNCHMRFSMVEWDEIASQIRSLTSCQIHDVFAFVCDSPALFNLLFKVLGPLLGRDDLIMAIKCIEHPSSDCQFFRVVIDGLILSGLTAQDAVVTLIKHANSQSLPSIQAIIGATLDFEVAKHFGGFFEQCCSVANFWIPVQYMEKLLEQIEAEDSTTWNPIVRHLAKHCDFEGHEEVQYALITYYTDDD